MKKLVIILLLLCISACSEKKFFFAFDEVEYYRLKNDTLIKIENNSDSIALKVYNKNFPDNLDNIKFVEILKQERFLKFILNKQDVLNLNNIFKKRFSFIQSDYSCIPNYRDILILKNKKSTIGIAKICIECEKFHFVGNKDGIETQSFGENNEFEKLNKIFKKYN